MQPGRRQQAAGTSSRSQPGQGEKQPTSRLGFDVCFGSCVLSSHLFGEVVYQPWLLFWGCWRRWDCWGAMKPLPECHCCYCLCQAHVLR